MELINAAFEYSYSIQMVVVVAFGIAFLVSQAKTAHK